MTPSPPPRILTPTQVAVQDLSRPWQAAETVKAIISLIKRGSRRIKLELRGCRRAFPNAVAPLRAALDEFERKGLQIEVNNDDNNPILEGLIEPLSPDDIPSLPHEVALSRTYRFESPSDVHALVSNMVASLSRCHECSPGVLLALEWCLNEIADNVIQHSQAAGGVLAANLQAAKQYLALCVSDVGVGIRNSFEACGHRFESDEDAIRAALQRGVTRDASIHMGNGLWGLRQIVNANSGSLGVKSGAVTYLLTDDREEYRDRQKYMDEKRKTTSVDFQLQLDTTIDVNEALQGYEPVNLRLESRETASGDHILVLRESELGTGTRIAGQAVRTEVLNMLHEGATRVVLDCTGVRMSSSFVDEVFGMLVVSLGFGNYTQQIGVKGLDPFDASLMHDIVAKRMTIRDW